MVYGNGVLKWAWDYKNLRREQYGLRICQFIQIPPVMPKFRKICAVVWEAPPLKKVAGYCKRYARIMWVWFPREQANEARWISNLLQNHLIIPRKNKNNHEISVTPELASNSRVLAPCTLGAFILRKIMARVSSADSYAHTQAKISTPHELVASPAADILWHCWNKALLYI